MDIGYIVGIFSLVDRQYTCLRPKLYKKKIFMKKKRKSINLYMFTV